MSDRKQRVVLNGQKSLLKNVNAGIVQGSILELLLFLIYINNLSGDLSSTLKLLTDDAPIFNVAHDINTSGNERNSDLKKIRNCSFQWKPSQHFNVQSTLYQRCLKVTLTLVKFISSSVALVMIMDFYIDE